MDSAYPLTTRTIPVFKRPAALEPNEAKFNKSVSNIRVRSEHCMGALKGRFQCLRGLRVDIKTPADHLEACQWMTVAMILHNLCIDVEGPTVHAREQFADEDVGIGNGAGVQEEDALDEDDIEGEGNEKRQQLVEELMAFREM